MGLTSLYSDMFSNIISGLESMGQCYGKGQERKEQGGRRDIQRGPVPLPVQKVTKVEEIDFVKANLKTTRDKIDNLINQHEREIDSINR